ncbi:MAG: hypothetical protein WBM62_02425, partial [Crocosphaera sp.]
MKKVTFECNVSLRAIFDDGGWWFSWLRSNVVVVPPSAPPLDPFEGLMGLELSYKGKGNGNGRTSDEIR